MPEQEKPKYILNFADLITLIMAFCVIILFITETISGNIPEEISTKVILTCVFIWMVFIFGTLTFVGLRRFKSYGKRNKKS